MPRMHQTTIRFAPDLWAALEQEAARSGVSVAHYVRDAAVSRLAFAAGAEAGHAGLGAGSQSPPRRLAARTEAEPTSADAVRAQSRRARARAKRLRTESDLLRLDGHVRREAADALHDPPAAAALDAGKASAG